MIFSRQILQYNPTDPYKQESHEPEDEVEEEHGVLDASGDVGEATGYSPSSAPAREDISYDNTDCDGKAKPVVPGLLFRVN